MLKACLLTYLQNIRLIWVYRSDFDWNDNDAHKLGIILTGQQEAFGLNTHSSNQNRLFCLKERMRRRKEQESHHPTLRRKTKQMHTVMM